MSALLEEGVDNICFYIDMFTSEVFIERITWLTRIIFLGLTVSAALKNPSLDLKNYFCFRFL